MIDFMYLQQVEILSAKAGGMSKVCSKYGKIGSVICLGYAYFFTKSEAGYAYKHYAYKEKNM